MSRTAAGTIALDEQLCFALYNASRAFTACYREVLAPYGLTYPQYIALMALWEKSPMTVNELGKRLYLDSGTLSPLIKRLEAMDLVSRSRSPEDERVVMVALTPQGTALRSSGLDISAAICQQTGMSEAELHDLRRRVQDLADVVRTDRT